MCIYRLRLYILSNTAFDRCCFDRSPDAKARVLCILCPLDFDLFVYCASAYIVFLVSVIILLASAPPLTSYNLAQMALLGSTSLVEIHSPHFISMMMNRAHLPFPRIQLQSAFATQGQLTLQRQHPPHK